MNLLQSNNLGLKKIWRNTVLQISINYVNTAYRHYFTGGTAGLESKNWTEVTFNRNVKLKINNMKLNDNYLSCNYFLNNQNNTSFFKCVHFSSTCIFKMSRKDSSHCQSMITSNNNNNKRGRHQELGSLQLISWFGFTQGSKWSFANCVNMWFVTTSSPK